ncbi:type I restriction-modification system subunit M [Rhizobium lentis]|uniref:site-specific DNA-methyltransferase (adenine-specific) n=1 Tax=Rhizobium lentis TaxID=1138194 RepID=A0ABS7IPZ3_9HYPH|nr:class I SAM-dependent DNA methyltransferase [Rhizobium lentis]MBX5018021.1 SAM-dependent DNA methyltransferase [Rhizobium lentis]MBX5092341.1 SAM-dependent DNA methyltransferase [Rhizobium lentis]
MPRGKKPASNNATAKGANPAPSIAATLFAAADKLRGNMDAAEYKHVALGLIFLKYISDRFDARIEEVKANPEEAFLLDDPDAARDLIVGADIFFVPERARWTFLKENATSTKPTIGELVDQAMIAIEAENPTLKGVLTKNYARQELDQTKLSEVLKLFSDIQFEDAHHGQDVLGRVYEYFLGEFAKLEGKRGGQYYTAGCVVKLLVAMLEPFKGRVYDPCCGSGGMFVQSERFVEEHAGKHLEPKKARDQIAVYGQESNATTWRLAKMNLAIRGIEANLGSKWADTFHEDLHKGLMAKYVLANPPFNDSDWGGDKLRGDARWRYGVPPAGNANFAWLQHIIYHLAPDGYAGVVLANGSLSSQQSGEGDIRRALIEGITVGESGKQIHYPGLVDCIVALPPQLFSTTQIPVCLWFLARDKSNGLSRDKKLRDRTNDILFIDARNLGTMVSRTMKELTDEDIAKVVDTYHAWREAGGGYEDIPGFAKSATLREVAEQGFVLTPGRYVGTEAAEEDGEGFDAKMTRLTSKLIEQQLMATTLDNAIMADLKRLGYGEQ